MRSTPIQALHEPYANLYLGDYFADTLDLSADEHRALRLLLLETRGGSNALVNLATVRRPCNLSKGSKTAEEWGPHKRINCRQRS